jgi:hypothetical protein
MVLCFCFPKQKKFPHAKTSHAKKRAVPKKGRANHLTGMCGVSLLADVEEEWNRARRRR